MNETPAQEVPLHFDQATHRYWSEVLPGEWKSVTAIIGSLHEKFDAVKVSELCARKGKGIYYGKTPEQIREMWEANASYATSLGTWYHENFERKIIESGVIFAGREKVKINPTSPPETKTLKVHAPPAFVNGTRTAPPQRLAEGVYPEHLSYDAEMLVCGHADLVIVNDGMVDIFDHKVYTEARREGYKGKTMLPPVDNIPDSNVWHCCLQLSMYMRMILKHNPELKPGKLVLRHVLFHEIENMNGIRNVLHTMDEKIEPVVREVQPIKLKYLERESLLAMETHLKT